MHEKLNSSGCGRDSRDHGEPFPLPVPSVLTDASRSAAPNYVRHRLQRRRRHEVCCAEATRALNFLSSTSAASLRRGSGPRGNGRSGAPSATQQSILDRVSERVRGYGQPPAGLSSRDAFSQVLKGCDIYHLGAKNVAPYIPELLKVTKGRTRPKPATSLLPPAEARIIAEPDKFIARGAAELSRWREENPSVQPYWDPSLRASRRSRLDLYSKLAAGGLLCLVPVIRSRVGLFFVWKSSRKGIRLIVDAREPNAMHKTPPKTALSGGGPLSEMEIDAEQLADALGGLGELSSVRLPHLDAKLLEGGTADVEDGFYQFAAPQLAEWFGMNDAVLPHEVGLRHYYDGGLQEFVEVKQGVKYFPAFVGMPQGWSWALHFCNSAVQYGVEVATGTRDGLVVDRRTPVQLTHRVGYGAYVDNVLVVGAPAVRPLSGLETVLDRLRDLGFSLHEETSVCVEIEMVGLVLNTRTGVWRHRRQRAWELYYATKHFMGFGKVPAGLLRLFLGKYVHHFSIMRPGMSVFHHAYRALGQAANHVLVPLPSAVKVELRAAMGLLFLAEARLCVPEAKFAYCGDATLNGFALQVRKVEPIEVKPLRSWKEKWRFVPVEEEGEAAPPTEAGPSGTDHGWRAAPLVLDTSFSRWMAQTCSLRDLGEESIESSDVLEAGSFMRDGRRYSDYEVIGLVPRLPSAFLSASQWQTIVKRRWEKRENIHMKEGRVCLMGLRRHARSSANHGTRLLSLTDNLSSGLAFEKSRAKRLDLLSLVRRAAAVRIGCGILWSIRYVESERNPSDHDSSAFEKRRPPAKPPPRRSRAEPPEEQPRHERRARPSEQRGGGSTMRQRRAAERPSLGRDSPRCSRSALGGAHSSCIAPAAQAFLEVFSGAPRLTPAFTEARLRCACPVRGPRRRSGRHSWEARRRTLLGWIDSGLVWYVHLGVPRSRDSPDPAGAADFDSEWVSFVKVVVDRCLELQLLFSVECSPAADELRDTQLGASLKLQRPSACGMTRVLSGVRTEGLVS